MKKFVSILLLIALVCSLCATGVFAAALSPEELYEKYADVIDALEAEDFDAAFEAVSALVPEKEYEEIVLTEENFFDYFEIVVDDAHIERNSSGKIKYIYPGNLVVKVKEEYYDLLDRENSTAAFGVKAKKDLYRAKIDWKTGEIKLNDSKDDDVKKEVKKLDWFESSVNTFVDMAPNGRFYSTYFINGDVFFFKHPQYKAWISGRAEPDLDVKYYQIVYRDIEVVNLEGSLFIAK